MNNTKKSIAGHNPDNILLDEGKDEYLVLLIPVHNSLLLKEQQTVIGNVPHLMRHHQLSDIQVMNKL
jgi:hypothetical protein